MKLIKKICVGLVNYLGKRRHYRTVWVEDLPDNAKKDTIYIVGGRKYPYYAVVPCPKRKCAQLIHLEIAKEAKKRWRVTEHEDGSVSLQPSIYVTGEPCGCHYWVSCGRVVWSDFPPLWVPKSNRLRK